jgi:hypothetical protein
MQDDASLFLFKARVQVRTTDWRKKKKKAQVTGLIGHETVIQ